MRTLGFAYVFAIYSFIQPYGYRRTYPTVSAREAFAATFGNNVGLRIFYGKPLDLTSVAGYSAWRVGGTLAIAAAVFGVLAAVRARRAEEEAGRMEIMLATGLSRNAAYAAAMQAIAYQTLVLFAAELVGFVLGGLPAAGAAYLSLATVSVVPVFAGIGALASEIAPTRRGALSYGAGTVGVFLLLRVVADTLAGGGWLRWLTPLGWAEELRPFAGARPLVLALPAVTTFALAIVPLVLGRLRDVGSGLVEARTDAEANLRLLSSPFAHAFRSERGGLVLWSASAALFGLVLGIVSESVSSAGIPKGLEQALAKLGSGSILTPVGYLSFLFFFFILAISLFACSQVVAARREEAAGQLETLLAQPVGRIRWLGGRVVIATFGAVCVAVAAAVATWLGATSVRVHVPLGRLLEAGANCVPSSLLFLGIAVLVYGLVPRASAALAYGAVITSFLWQAVGALVGAPRWLIDLTPFAWVGLVPTQAFRPVPAVTMAAIGIGAALLGLGAFRRRDLLGD